MITFFPRSRRLLPSGSMASIVFGTNETTRPKNEFRAALFVVLEIDVIPMRHHSAFALADGAHVDREISLRYPELFTSAKVGSDLCTMNDVLAREARDVRA